MKTILGGCVLTLTASTFLILLEPHFAQAQAYVIGRYPCVDDENGSDRGDCTITTQGVNCQVACANSRADLQRRGDPCRICVNEIDNTRHWTGQQPDWIQGGACQGFRC